MEIAPCPASPNCVSTEAADKRHAIAPFILLQAGAEVWPEIRAAVLAFPRTRAVEERDGYLRVECRSAVFRFVDELEVQLRAPQNLVAVRSAARLGRYDFGVNRRRAEKLRRLLQSRGIVKGPAGG